MILKGKKKKEFSSFLYWAQTQRSTQTLVVDFASFLILCIYLQDRFAVSSINQCMSLEAEFSHNKWRNYWSKTGQTMGHKSSLSLLVRRGSQWDYKTRFFVYIYIPSPAQLAVWLESSCHSQWRALEVYGSYDAPGAWMYCWSGTIILSTSAVIVALFFEVRTSPAFRFLPWMVPMAFVLWLGLVSFFIGWITDELVRDMIHTHTHICI